MNTTTSHNNDLQRPQTAIPANAVVSMLTQSANDAISHCTTSHKTRNLRQNTTTSAALEYLEWSKEHTEEALGFAKSIQQLLAPCLAQTKRSESHLGGKKFGKNLMILEDP